MHLPPGWEPVTAQGCALSWRRLRSAAAVAFLGSDGVCGPTTGRLAETLALTLTSRSRRVALLGVRAAPSRDRLSRLLVRALVLRADLLVLADEASAQALVAAGAPAPLRVGTDPAWAAVAGPSPSVERRDVVMVAVEPRDQQAELLGPLRELATAGLQIALQPWERTPSEATRQAHTLAEALGRGAELLGPVADLDAARRRFAAARLVVASPTRALIAAAAAETPFVATSGMYGRRIAKGLAQLAATDGDLPRALAAGIDAEPPSPEAVRTEIAAAEASFRLLRLLLSEGAEGADEVGIGTRLAPESWTT
jgi:polysaccharide pyruvyl transferase WcaK-like protein